MPLDGCQWRPTICSELGAAASIVGILTRYGALDGSDHISRILLHKDVMPVSLELGRAGRLFVCLATVSVRHGCDLGWMSPSIARDSIKVLDLHQAYAC